MKFNFKHFLAGIVVPLSLGATTFSSFKLSTTNPAVLETARPYLIEEISADGNEIKTYSGSSSLTDPYQIASDFGATPYLEDKFTAFPDIKMGIGSKITLYRAPVYIITDGKKKITVRSWGETVREILTDGKIKDLGVDDKINFSLDTEAELNMEIRITRVARTNVIEAEPISFSITKKENANLEKGTKNILQAGQDGVRTKTYLVIREDGEEVSRTLTKSEVTTAPVNQIIEVGTKVVVYGTGKATYYAWPAMSAKNKYYAASKTLPKGTDVWVVNTANGKGVKVTILDVVAADVAIDLSDTAFAQIASLSTGVINVRIEKYYPE